MDLIRYTKDQLKERIELLKKFLKQGYILEKDGTKSVLTPQMEANLLAGIEQGDKLGESFDNIFKTLQQIGELGDVFSSLGDTLGSGFLSEAGVQPSAVLEAN